jgi:ribose/xylose/arabinose/galactoside ABC-type transport system permease subunit
MKIAALILVWLICLANSLFFFDVIYWYLEGVKISPNTKANCDQFQAIFSLVMLFIVAVVLCVYTHILLKYTR